MTTYLMPSMQTPDELQAMADALGLPLSFFKPKGLPVVRLKFNPNHQPGGSPEGGQFAPEGTTGAPGTGAKPVTGLRYDKQKKQWVHKDGTPVSPELAARIKAIGVKPGYVDVELNPDPNAALQARGTDAKGRTQYMYSKAHSEEAAAEKFARLREFNAVLPDVNTRLSGMLGNPKLSPTDRDTAAALLLIAGSGIRVGSDSETLADTKAFGATTLLGEHITLRAAGRIDLEFVGKSGQINKASIVDAKLHAYLKAKQLGPTDRVFGTTDARTREMVKEVAGKNFSPKDFRTWTGTVTAMAEVLRYSAPTSAKAEAKLRNEVAKVVAAKLNNTPSVALKAYIDPAVFSHWGGP